MIIGGPLKIGLIIVGIIGVVGILVAANKPEAPSPSPTPTFSPRVRPSVEPTPSAEPTPPAKEISWTIIHRGTLGTGAGGIVIPTEYLNAADMALVGEKLKLEYANDVHVSTRVFTDNRAFALYDKVIAGQATQAEDALYTKNFVGWYKKNGSNGYHEFDTFVDGVMNEHKTLTY